MTAASKRRTVVFGCVAIAVLVLANAAWQWKAASVYGWTGLKVRVESSFPGEANAPQTRMLVEHVVPGSPASFSGFQPGDRIVSLDGSTDQLTGERLW